MAGELLLLGRPRVGSMDAADAYGVLVALAVRQAGPGSVIKITKALLEPYWLTDETWGTGPSAEEGQDAMMAMLTTGKVPEGVAKRKG